MAEPSDAMTDAEAARVLAWLIIWAAPDQGGGGPIPHDCMRAIVYAADTLKERSRVASTAMAEPTDARVEAALDEWFRDQVWRQCVPPFRTAWMARMRAALAAADAVVEREHTKRILDLEASEAQEMGVWDQDALKRAIVAGMDEPGSSE